MRLKSKVILIHQNNFAFLMDYSIINKIYTIDIPLTLEDYHGYPGTNLK